MVCLRLHPANALTGKRSRNPLNCNHIQPCYRGSMPIREAQMTGGLRLA